MHCYGKFRHGVGGFELHFCACNPFTPASVDLWSQHCIADASSFPHDAWYVQLDKTNIWAKSPHVTINILFFNFTHIAMYFNHVDVQLRNVQIYTSKVTWCSRCNTLDALRISYLHVHTISTCNQGYFRNLPRTLRSCMFHGVNLNWSLDILCNVRKVRLFCSPLKNTRLATGWFKHLTNGMHPKRRFWKSEQSIGRVFSKHFSIRVTCN
jgi:hypothetical protein